MRNGVANLVAGGVLALASGAAGYFLGRSNSDPPETAGPQVQAVETDLGPVLEELRSLRSEVRAARGSRTPVSETGATAQEAIPEDRIAKLQETLDQIAKRQVEAARREGRGAGFADLAAIARRIQLLEGGFEAAGTVRNEIRAAHARWSRADLHARYGAPRSECPAGQVWTSTYELGNSSLVFELADDEVVEAFVHLKEH